MRGMGWQRSTSERDARDEEHTRLVLAVALSQKSNCIDIGSHTGAVLAEIVRCAPNGRHIAYEPLPHLAEQLAARFPRVDVRNAAVSNRSGSAPFTYVKGLPDYSGFKERSYPGRQDTETITVRVERLDSSLPPGYVPDLLKVDVEGAEREVIEGAIGTISRHKPTILFEHGKGAADRYGTRPTDVFELLCREAELRIFDIDGNGPLTVDEFSATFEENRLWNFVACP
jgi:FkbM family methyltransferase